MITLEDHSAMQSLQTQTDCPTRHLLQQYVAGWIDDEQATQIEQHLVDCASCEQAVRELEGTPDSLLQSLRDAPLDEADRPSAVANAELEDESVVKAIQQASQLLEPSVQPAWEAWQPPAGDLGAYELLRPLARGGMGAVYLARHRQLGKTVAIKLLPAPRADNQDALARFQREIQAAGRLNHRSIVAATDAGTQQGTHYLVMEFVSGMDLSQLARQLGKLPISDACELARQAALGLSYAHAEGIVHRDIKPSNLMLDETGQVKILDFGLAQLSFWDQASVELTTVGQLMGTLDYMAPEQAERCGAVDYRVDLYGLGSTLFRLLCGRAPLAATPHQSPLEKLRLLAQHHAPRLDTLRPDAPSELADLVAHLLAQQPQDRPASAAHVAERLATFTGSANLRGLIAAAQAAAQAEPTASKPDELAALGRGAGTRPSSAHVAPVTASGSAGRRNRRWWLAAAAFPLLMLAGILIVLETQKGQLVIDSEVTDVRVQLRKGGQTIQELEIHPGATATRLLADQYEIVIDSPSDSIGVDKQRIELRRGQTVVARIHQRPTAPVAVETVVPPAGPVTATAAADEPLYDGQTLSHWLDTLQRDRSPENIGKALVAISAMVTPTTAERITEVMVNVLPTIDGRMELPQRGDARWTVDGQGIQILIKANPGRALFELLANEIERGETAWSERLLKSRLVLLQASSLTEVEPLIDALEQHVFASSAENPLAVVQAAQWFIRNLLVRLIEAASGEQRQRIVTRLLGILESSPHVGLEFWLNGPIDDSWPPKLRQAVTDRAAKTMTEMDAPAALVAQAAMILTGQPEPALQRIDELAQSINDRLVSLSETPQRMLARVEVSLSLYELTVRKFSLPGDNDFRFVIATSRGFLEAAYASETLAILDLATVLTDNADFTSGLRAIRDATAAASATASEAAAPNTAPVPPGTARSRRGPGGSLAIDWPSLTITVKQVQPSMRDRADAIAALAPEQLMAYIIHHTVDSIMTDSDAPADN